MRIALHIPTGRILESQELAAEGTVFANAIAAGFPADEVEERDVSPGEYATLFDAQPKTPDEQNAPILAQLAAIDAKKVRALSEAILNSDLTRLQALEDEAAALRSQLQV